MQADTQTLLLFYKHEHTRAHAVKLYFHGSITTDLNSILNAVLSLWHCVLCLRLVSCLWIELILFPSCYFFVFSEFWYNLDFLSRKSPFVILIFVSLSRGRWCCFRSLEGFVCFACKKIKLLPSFFSFHNQDKDKSQLKPCTHRKVFSYILAD